MFFLQSIYQVLSSQVVIAVVNVLALISLYFGVKAWSDGRKIGQATDKLAETADSIEKSLSTSHISEYPGYLAKVTGLVQVAKSSVLIVSVVPAIGAYSAPEAWEDLSNALIHLQQHGVSVTLITGNAQRRLQNTSLQFSEAKDDWDGWQKVRKKDTGPSNGELIGSMCERYGFSDTRADGGWFVGVVEEMQEHLLISTYYKATKLLAGDPMPMLVWIIDSHEAIFAINNIKGAPPAFYTRDKSIVDALTGYAERIQVTESKLG